MYSKMLRIFCKFAFFGIIIFNWPHFSSQQLQVENDLIITQSQKDILDEFKERVISRLPQEYMKTEIYLIRWLRARHFDIYSAEQMLLENLKWRKKNDMENIMKLDWVEFETEFPFILQGCDRAGSPVVTTHAGYWDVRSAVVSGKTERLIRYIGKSLEEIAVLTRTAQKDGENLTQYSIILDMDGYNLAMHGCPLCISVYANFLYIIQNYYPGTVSSAKLINVPNIFLTAWNIIREFLSPQGRRIVQLFGKDKTLWKKELLKIIDPGELTTEFGGLNREGITVEDVRNYKGQVKCFRLKGIRDSKVSDDDNEPQGSS